MNPFSSTTLPSASPLFRGRQAELARLKQICQDDVTAYRVIYGGHQNGKTSLLRQLEADLRLSVHVCTINFQRIPGATPSQVYAHIGQGIATVLPMGVSAAQIVDAPDLTTFLTQVLQRREIRRLVLLLDELGALPTPTRAALGSALRALFQDRLTSPALAKLQIIFSGGIELYNLVVTEASSLHNICEATYLEDLTRDEAVGLIADGLLAAGADHAPTIGEMVYARVNGHPYLTQRIGGLLVEYTRRGEAIGPEQVAHVERQIGQDGDPLLRQIQNDMHEHQLESAVRRLLTTSPRFTRLDDAMTRLELIGLAKRDGDRWAPRNPLLAEVFREQVGLPPAPRVPVRALPPPPRTKKAPTTSPSVGRQTWDKRYTWVVIPFLLIIAVIAIPQTRSALVGGVSQPTVAPTVLRTPTSAIALAATVAPTVVPTDAPTVVSTIAPPAVPTDAPTVAPTIAPTPSQTPLPAWVPALVKVAAGSFLMGSSDTDTLADSDEKPQHSRELPDYWIGKTEVTNAQFRPFVEGDGYTNKDYWTKAGWDWREAEKIVKPGFWDDSQWNGDTQPVVGISWFEAVAYCHWLSAQTGHEFRLPSEAEWEKAARGTDGQIWPWGNTWEANRVNSKEAGVEKTTPVGQYPDGASPYGALDMAGNAYEWVATKYGKGYPYQLEEEWQSAYLGDGDSARVLRGGSYGSKQKSVRGADRYYYDARDRGINRGLRVASRSPLPGSGS
ncbi:MAG: SUMF1/EgtB/PvdO family nonheme iron enzyme [Chloroflexales bacterium]